MAKPEAKKLAYIYFVEHGLSQKECATKAQVTEKTISSWVEVYGWKATRDARIFSTNQRAENIKEVLGGLAEETVELTRELRNTTDRDAKNELRSSMASISDQAAKWRKTLDDIKTDGKIDLSTYLNVMEDVFKILHSKHPDIHHQLIDFQEDLIQIKANELG